MCEGRPADHGDWSASRARTNRSETLELRSLVMVQSLGFEGRVSFRSSLRRGGPPGESAIQDLNPARVASILQITGWHRLERGSLNLEVADGVVDSLAKLKPILEERASDVVYPPPYQNIPLMREAYWYYLGSAEIAAKAIDVVVRRARVPVPNRLELFAPLSLSRFFQLQEDSILAVRVLGSEQ
jgi:hypothetical protein